MIDPGPVFILRAIASGAFGLSHHSSSIEGREKKALCTVYPSQWKRVGGEKRKRKGKKTVGERKKDKKGAGKNLQLEGKKI